MKSVVKEGLNLPVLVAAAMVCVWLLSRAFALGMQSVSAVGLACGLALWGMGLLGRLKDFLKKQAQSC